MEVAVAHVTEDTTSIQSTSEEEQITATKEDSKKEAQS